MNDLNKTGIPELEQERDRLRRSLGVARKIIQTYTLMFWHNHDATELNKAAALEQTK